MCMRLFIFCGIRISTHTEKEIEGKRDGENEREERERERDDNIVMQRTNALKCVRNAKDRGREQWDQIMNDKWHRRHH